MCGIAGYWDWNHHCSESRLLHVITGMTQMLKNRGPDYGGLWIERKSGMALGHRRLAIRDLSNRGNQPMVSPDGRYVLVYNGEIYNVPKIASELAIHNIYPTGTSDTEALLLSLMQFGIKRTLKNIVGMFAFALWDRSDRRLFLARDRFGVKPLYWTNDNNRFFFASQPDAFYCVEDWNPELDLNIVALYLRFGYIPSPHGIWQKVYKLPPAHFMEISQNEKRMESYWDTMDAALVGLSNPLAEDENEAVNQLDALLTDSVSSRMVSDVPLGAFLSGGIDSTIVTVLMQKCSRSPIRTFSIGFEEDKYNEAPYAAAIASYLHTDHTELYVPAKVAWEIIPQLAEIYDEPFGDASAVPTTLLSRLTRKYVTIALSGDGGDELFAGYSRYFNCLQNAPKSFANSTARSMLGRILKIFNPAQWDHLNALLPKNLRLANAGTRLYNFIDLELTGSFANYYQRYFMNYWWHPETLIKSGTAPDTVCDDKAIWKQFSSRLALMQYFDAMLYLSDDILVKVDRATMSCSLEARVPLLDHNVFKFAWRLPIAWRQKNGQGKYLMVKLLERYVPKKLIDRPKMGFGIPIGEWLTDPLREWAESLLSRDKLDSIGFIRADPIRRAWERQLSGASNWEYHLWVVLMLLAWLERKNPDQCEEIQLPVCWA